MSKTGVWVLRAHRNILLSDLCECWLQRIRYHKHVCVMEQSHDSHLRCKGLTLNNPSTVKLLNASWWIMTVQYCIASDNAFAALCTCYIKNCNTPALFLYIWSHTLQYFGYKVIASYTPGNSVNRHAIDPTVFCHNNLHSVVRTHIQHGLQPCSFYSHLQLWEE